MIHNCSNRVYWHGGYFDEKWCEHQCEKYRWENSTGPSYGKGYVDLAFGSEQITLSNWIKNTLTFKTRCLRNWFQFGCPILLNLNFVDQPKFAFDSNRAWNVAHFRLNYLPFTAQSGRFYYDQPIYRKMIEIINNTVSDGKNEVLSLGNCEHFFIHS